MMGVLIEMEMYDLLLVRSMAASHRLHHCSRIVGLVGCLFDLVGLLFVCFSFSIQLISSQTHLRLISFSSQTHSRITSLIATLIINIACNNHCARHTVLGAICIERIEI